MTSFGFRSAQGSTMGCYLTVKFAETGYKAVEPVVNWLEASPHQIDHIEANDSKCLFTLRYITLRYYTLRYVTFCSVLFCYMLCYGAC